MTEVQYEIEIEQVSEAYFRDEIGQDEAAEDLKALGLEWPEIKMTLEIE